MFYQYQGGCMHYYNDEESRYGHIYMDIIPPKPTVLPYFVKWVHILYNSTHFVNSHPPPQPYFARSYYFCQSVK